MKFVAFSAAFLEGWKNAFSGVLLFNIVSFLAAISKRYWLVLATEDILVIPLYIVYLGSSIFPKKSLKALLPWPIIFSPSFL